MAVDINNLGIFVSIDAVWMTYPEGGHEGDYLTIQGTRFRWNKYLRIWESATSRQTTARKNQVVGGDMTINNDLIVGDELIVRGDTFLEGDVEIEGTLRAKKVKQPNCGFFQSEEALLARYPKPEVGMWATVGDVMPGLVYRCETDGEWTNTGEEGGVDIETVNYEVVDNLHSSNQTKALSARMGQVLDQKIYAVEDKIQTVFDESEYDFAIGDGSGNDVMVIDKGEIRTHKFDSKNTPKNTENEIADFSIGDEKGNNILNLRNGNIFAKNFNGESVSSFVSQMMNKKLVRYTYIPTWYLGTNNSYSNYDNRIYAGGFEVTKLNHQPGYNMVMNFSQFFMPTAITLHYVYTGTNDIPVFDSKNQTLTVWGTDVTEENIIAFIHPGEGDITMTLRDYQRPFLGIFCNDVQLEKTLTITNTSALVYQLIDGADDPTYEGVYPAAIEGICNRYNALSEQGRVGYIWISDLHYNQNNKQNDDALDRQLKSIVEIANKVQIDFVVIGGDLIDGTTTVSYLYETMQRVVGILSKCSKPVLFLSGNHDDNSYSHDLSVTNKGKFCRSLMVDNTDAENIVWCSDPVDTYYYFDMPKKNIRVICLDFIDYPSGSYGLNYWGFSQQQVRWLCGTALANTGSKNVVIMSHGQLVDKKYEFWNLGDHGGYTTDIKNAIIAFNSHRNISLYGTTYDFSSATGTVKVVHSGHFHGDMDLYIDTIPNIVTSCAKNEAYIQYMIPVAGKTDVYVIPDAAAAAQLHANGYGYEIRIPQNRDYGTINEALFDVVSINSRYINVIRVGAGEDRKITI